MQGLIFQTVRMLPALVYVEMGHHGLQSFSLLKKGQFSQIYFLVLFLYRNFPSIVFTRLFSKSYASLLFGEIMEVAECFHLDMDGVPGFDSSQA
jgi:hypothetical protein